jgi:hypothetical protein
MNLKIENIATFCMAKNLSLHSINVLSPLPFYVALEYAIRKVQENQDGLKLNGADHILAYVDDVNLLGGNIDTVNIRQKIY